ncbi:hypothetical protein LL965_15880 [Xanthomonas cassavae CFBP 4642]|uniref:Uncharacterized protein n=1 Tax=Xanthomonas cassavae CFBP 4642 TaxID=1219375 RepID=A0ABS8HHN6_9XANT|nr:hypothetical protein [Xanthomonas cassavae]MCC4621490.1 hypothetical protein [Xanthomonas cassavae CFBP 4642]
MPLFAIVAPAMQIPILLGGPVLRLERSDLSAPRRTACFISPRKTLLRVFLGDWVQAQRKLIHAEISRDAWLGPQRKPGIFEGHS